MRQKIWATYINLKFKSFLLLILVDKYQKWDKYINVFLALAASTSVGSWVIWDDYPFIWSGVIIGSQIISVVKPYFPYYKYVKELSIKSQKLELIVIEFEKLWYNYNSSGISENLAAKKYFELKKGSIEELNFDDDIFLSTSKRDENKANKRMETFLKSNYNLKPKMYIQ